VSLWRSSRDLAELAYRHPEHRRVIEATPGADWYAGSWFVRFEELDITGDRRVPDRSEGRSR
jgi:hypothetical protein